MSKTLKEPSFYHGIIETDHIDAHDEIVPISVLEQMVENINKGIMMLNSNHDPQIPPQGKVLSAKLVKLADGYNGVQAEMEMYQTGIPQIILNDRKLVRTQANYTQPTFIIDRNYENPKYRDAIEQICNILGQVEPDYEVKKAEDFSGILQFAGMYVLDPIAKAFIKELSKDAYSLLKLQVKQILGFDSNNTNKPKLTVSGKVKIGRMNLFLKWQWQIQLKRKLIKHLKPTRYFY
jgi:hypothetical protein